MYSHSPEQLLNAVNAITARNELLPGIHTSVIRLGITNRGFTDQITGKPVESSFVFSNPEQARISRINLLMLEEAEKKDGIGLWLSPPDSINQTGKILVAVRQGNEIVEYDTTGLTFSGANFATFMTNLSLFRRDGYYFLPNMDLLETIIPMPAAWEAIRNDQAEIKFNREVVEALNSGHKNYRVAFREKYGIDIALACPSNSLSVINKLVSPDGKIKTFAKTCGVCGGKINDWIEKGYQCGHCGEVYLGVC